MAASPILEALETFEGLDRHGIPEHCREGLLDYIRYGTPPGAFLRAVLANDLLIAVLTADPGNRDRLPDYVRFLYDHAPATCWGSEAAVRAWIGHGGLAGRDEHPEDEASRNGLASVRGSLQQRPFRQRRGGRVV